jgi:hypothetical protein
VTHARRCFLHIETRNQTSPTSLSLLTQTAVATASKKTQTSRSHTARRNLATCDHGRPTAEAAALRSPAPAKSGAPRIQPKLRSASQHRRRHFDAAAVLARRVDRQALQTGVEQLRSDDGAIPSRLVNSPTRSNGIKPTKIASRLSVESQIYITPCHSTAALCLSEYDNRPPPQKGESPVAAEQ